MRKKMVMSAVEWCVAILLIVLFFWVDSLSMGSYTAKTAHELSERSYHYGPSQIVKEISVGKDTVVYLGIYKNWFSADTIIKRNLKWYPGGGTAGVEINRTKPLTYSWEISQGAKRTGLAKFYGYVTDPDITTVVLNTEIQNSANNGTGKISTMSQTIQKDRMFLFLWDTGGDHYVWKSIQGLDREGKVRYDSELN